MRRLKQVDVRGALRVAAIFHFLCGCSRGSLLPFLSLYLRRLGLEPMTAAVVMASRHLAWLLCGPAAGALARRHDKRRALISSSLLCSAAAALLLLLVPPADVRLAGAACNATWPGADSAQVADSAHIADSGPSSNSAHSVLQLTTSGAVPETAASSGTLPSFSPGVTFQTTAGRPVGGASPGQNGANNSGVMPTQEMDSVGVDDPPNDANFGSWAALNSTSVRRRRRRSEEMPKGEEPNGFDLLERLKVTDPQQQLFFLVLLVVSVWEGVAAPLDLTADDGLYEYLDFADAADCHGGSGHWGLLGVACGVGGAGILVSWLGCGWARRGAAHFLCYAGLAAAALPVACCLPLHLSRKRDRANGIVRALRLVRSSAHALLCATTALLAGAANSAADDFLLWHMQDKGSNELQMGAALAVALLAQAAFPLLAGKMSHILAPARLLAVGVATLAFQFLYYSLLWGPWVVLPAQVLSCLSAGALRWVLDLQCEDLAAPGAERSVRRVYSNLAPQLGGAVGSLAGGVVAQRAGLTWLFRAMAAVLAVWCAVLVPLQSRTPHQRRINYSRLLTTNASEASESESEQDWLDKAMESDNNKNNNDHRNYTHRINH